MNFGAVPVGEAAGAILAHSVRDASGVIRKGTRLDAGHVGRLAAAGVAEVVVARLDAGDVHEDAAAEGIARAVAGPNLRIEAAFTGRSNLYAAGAGVLTVDRSAIDRLNAIDPAVTVATLPEFAVVEPGRMVATVKIIPFAVSRTVVEAALEAAAGAVSVAPFKPFKVGLVATSLPGLKPSVMDKTRRLLEERLKPAGATLLAERRVKHEAGAVGAALADLRQAGADLLIAFGASATVDEDDVVPSGIGLAGGEIIHFGMPVDPGNLLVLGGIGATPVVGAPGCARSPRENGFDWILNRLLAGLHVTPRDIESLGVGGLLMEIVSRPQPREGGAVATASPTVRGIVLAAGLGRRMGGPNKLVATIAGKPIVRHAVEAALAAGLASVTVVTGHEEGAVRAALAGLDVTFVHNPDHAEGLSTSMRTGIAALPAETDAAIILLGDMPGITPAAIARLAGAFDPAAGALVVVPTFEGKRGNPVVWSARYFPELLAVHGDTGGR
ncbi:MAG TPA: molybdopterin-binding/glycosyltransferase family 2 protein, partial [Bauldia sp.]|nr:molybdopterin-binding/glycosyltransferase family 2 protein [Bauldia sp.]